MIDGTYPTEEALTETLLELTTRHFLRTGDWPQIDALQRTYHQAGGRGDLVRLAYRLGGLGMVDGTRHLRLTVKGLARCPDARPLLSDFMRAVQLAVTRYLDPLNDNPEICFGDLKVVIDSGSKVVDQVARLLQEESSLWSRWPSDWPKGCLGVSDQVHHYRDVQNIDEYLQVRDELTPSLLMSTSLVVDQATGPEPAPSGQDNKVALRLADLHPAIREACESRFASGHYPDAVQRAFVAFRDLIREALGGSALDGENLMGKAFGGESPPIRLVDPATLSGRNRQRGALLMSQGVVAALRNPLSHGSVEMEVAEALESVAVMSLLGRWVDARLVGEAAATPLIPAE